MNYFIARDLKVSGKVWSSTFFLKQRKIAIDEKVVSSGVPGCDLYGPKGLFCKKKYMYKLGLAGC